MGMQNIVQCYPGHHMRSTKPPPVIDSAQVIAYAILDQTVRWTGRQVLYVGDELLGAVPRLAICRNLFGELQDFLIMHCDNRWNVLGVVSAPTLRESMQKSERWYEGISKHWVKTHTSKKIAERWLRAQCAGDACSMCRKIPPETDGMFSKGTVNICFFCIRKMHQSIIDSEADR